MMQSYVTFAIMFQVIENLKDEMENQSRTIVRFREMLAAKDVEIEGLRLQLTYMSTN